jgi:hypothetical protein
VGEGTEVDVVSDEQQTATQPEWERTPEWQQVATNTGRRSTFGRNTRTTAERVENEKRWKGVKS